MSISTFFDEKTAHLLPEQDILVVGIPHVYAERTSNALKLILKLPNPYSYNYTNTRDGRLILERRAGINNLEKLLNIKESEPFTLEPGLIRGMTGGIVYLYNDGFILQSKHLSKNRRPLLFRLHRPI